MRGQHARPCTLGRMDACLHRCNKRRFHVSYIPAPQPTSALPIAMHCCLVAAAGTVEQFAAERGGTVVHKTADGTVELTPEDLLGSSLVEEAAAAQQGQATAAVPAAQGSSGSSGGGGAGGA